MGGHIALPLSKQSGSPAFQAVVDFFAPIEQTFFSIGGDIDKLPKLQIHHGEEDRVVLPEQSDKLEALLVSAGKVKDRDYEIHFYAGEGDGFKSAGAVKLSTDGAVEFFKKHLR